MPDKYYEWKRFWYPRGNIPALSDAGYLYDPEREYGQIFSEGVSSFEVIARFPCLILLGEPGVGKSYAVRVAHEAEAHAAEKVGSRSLFIDLGSYGDEGRLMDDLFKSSTWASWVDSEGRLILFLDSLDECLLNISFWHTHKCSSIEVRGSLADCSRVSIGDSDQLAYTSCANDLEVASGSVRHGVHTNGREVVTLARTERLSRFMYLHPNLCLYLRRKSPQDRRDASRYLGKEAPVVIAAGKGPAKGNLLDLGLGEAGPYDQLTNVPWISHGEARFLAVGRRNMSLRHQDPNCQQL
jgi:hypothetical protein